MKPKSQILRRPIHPCFCMDEEVTARDAIHRYVPESAEARRMDSVPASRKFPIFWPAVRRQDDDDDDPLLLQKGFENSEPDSSSSSSSVDA